MTRIRSYSRLGIAAALVLTTAACARDEPVDTEFAAPTAETEQPGVMEEQPADLVTAQQNYIAAWNGTDVDAVTAFFTDDATVVAGEDTYNGIAEIREQWVAEGVGIVSNLEATPESVTRTGNEIHEEGTYSHTVTPPEGDVQTVTGRYTVTWTLGADGTWRIRSTTVQQDAM